MKDNPFNNYFNKIWCLSGLDKQRLENSKKEFDKYGLDVTYYYNPMNPIIRGCCKLYYETDTYNEAAKYNGYNNVYNSVAACFVGHYDIIRTSYELGYDSILILEDDVRFLNDIDFDKIIEQTPKDWDVLQFYTLSSIVDITKKTRTIKNFVSQDDFWYKVTKPTDCRGNVMYALSRRAMEFYLTYYESNSPTVADFHYAIYNPRELNFYIRNYNIIDAQKHLSTIRKKTYND